MKKDNIEEIITLLTGFGLAPTHKRELPLFLLSSWAMSCTTLLKQSLGFSYEAISALGSKNKFNTLTNEDKIACDTRDFVENNFDNIHNLSFKKARDIFKASSKRISNAKTNLHKSPEVFLSAVVINYPKYLHSLAIYNCFLSYVGDDIEKTMFSSAEVNKISKERDMIAKLYPEIEENIKIACNLLGDMYGFDGDLLRYFTNREFSDYLLYDKNLSKNLRDTLELRRKKYLYYYIRNGSTEVVITDQTIVDKVHEKYFSPHPTIVNELMGSVAYAGKAKGKVFNMTNHTQSECRNMPEGLILVTSMTHPSDTEFLAKVAGIITDEGGILCHAAIVAREFQKPCIVGTRIATKSLNDGDEVYLDGVSGVITVLKHVVSN